MTGNFNKLFHKISLLSDVDAFPIVVDLFADILKNELDAQGEQLLKALRAEIFSPNRWDDLINMVALALPHDDVGIRSNFFSEYSAETQIPPIFSLVNKLFSYCQKRQNQLNNIALTVTLNAMQYVPKLTNIDVNSLPSRLKHYASKHKITNDEINFPDVRVAEEALYYIEDMRECIIQRNIGKSYDDETVMSHLDELEALYGVLLNYYDNLNRSKTHVSHSFYAFPHFVYCDKCWRLIPESYTKRHVQRCDEHNPNTAPSTAARKAKIVQDDFLASNPVFSRDAEKKLAELHKIWKPKYANISQDEWLTALETLQSCNLPTVTYDLAEIWVICPHTQKYLLKNGVDSMDVASILPVLIPAIIDQTPEEHQLYQSLYAILTKNFWLFRMDLAMAETWLSKYHQYFAKRTHGGARANTGGKRIGAGRPRKQR